MFGRRRHWACASSACTRQRSVSTIGRGVREREHRPELRCWGLAGIGHNFALEVKTGLAIYRRVKPALIEIGDACRAAASQQAELAGLSEWAARC